VVNNIPEIVYSRKSVNVALAILIALLGILSFGLGRLSAQTHKQATILSCENLEPLTFASTNETVSSQTSTPGGTIVASKNGAAYHFPWCSGAKRINEENKVWFKTKEEAEAAGYRAAANCKGL